MNKQTRREPSTGTRMSPEGYQRLIDSYRESPRDRISATRRASPEGYQRLIALCAESPSVPMAERVSQVYNGARTVVTDTGKLVGAVYNGGARVVGDTWNVGKAVVGGAARVIGTAWNAGTGVYNFVSQARAARKQADMQELQNYVGIAKTGLEIAAMAHELKERKKKKKPSNVPADIEATFRLFAQFGMNPFNVAENYARWVATQQPPQGPTP